MGTMSEDVLNCMKALVSNVMKLVRTVCLEKLKLLSTLHSTNLKNLLQSVNDPESKSKDLMRHSSLPRKTAQSQTQLLFPNMSITSITSPPSSLPNNSIIGTVAKTSPPITSPPSSLPNNSRADRLKLFGENNRGEGVSDSVRENTHCEFGNKNSCRFSEE